MYIFEYTASAIIKNRFVIDNSMTLRTSWALRWESMEQDE